MDWAAAAALLFQAGVAIKDAIDKRGEEAEAARIEALAHLTALVSAIETLPASEKADHDTVVGDDKAWGSP